MVDYGFNAPKKCIAVIISQIMKTPPNTLLKLLVTCIRPRLQSKYKFAEILTCPQNGFLKYNKPQRDLLLQRTSAETVEMWNTHIVIGSVGLRMLLQFCSLCYG